MYGFLASACLTAMYLAEAMFDNEVRRTKDTNFI
jgi:hypothetical protein